MDRTQRVAPSSAARYLLRVNLVGLQQPLMGGAFTVTIETGWSLQDLSTDEHVWQKGITSSHTVTMGEAFWGPTRVRLATEGAARKNIRRGLELISKLDLAGLTPLISNAVIRPAAPTRLRTPA